MRRPLRLAHYREPFELGARGAGKRAIVRHHEASRRGGNASKRCMVRRMQLLTNCYILHILASLASTTHPRNELPSREEQRKTTTQKARRWQTQNTNVSQRQFAPFHCLFLISAAAVDVSLVVTAAAITTGRSNRAAERTMQMFIGCSVQLKHVSQSNRLGLGLLCIDRIARSASRWETGGASRLPKSKKCFQDRRCIFHPRLACSSRAASHT